MKIPSISGDMSIQTLGTIESYLAFLPDLSFPVSLSKLLSIPEPNLTIIKKNKYTNIICTYLLFTQNPPYSTKWFPRKKK